MLAKLARGSLLALLVVAVFATTAGSAAAYLGGKLQLICAPQAAQQADPLADFGKTSPFLNTPAGASGIFGPNELMSQLDGTTATTCQFGPDWSQLWFPTPMQADGSPATVVNSSYYVLNKSQNISPAADFNPGLRYELGDQSCTTMSCAHATFYCFGTHKDTGVTVPTTAQCPSGGYQETILLQNVEQCWDGVSMGAGFGDSSPDANVSAAANSGNDPCATPYVIPGLAVTVAVAQNGVGGYLASDYVPGTIDDRTTCPGCTANFGYAFAFGPTSALQAVINGCLESTVTPTPKTGGLTCKEGPAAPGATGTSSIYVNDPNTNLPEDGLNGEPYNLITP